MMDYTIYNEMLLKKLNKIKHWKRKYIRKEILKFTKKHKSPLTFAIVAGIDLFLFGYCGCFWLGGFSYPVENQLIIDCGEQYYAKQCGLYTFNMV